MKREKFIRQLNKLVVRKNNMKLIMFIVFSIFLLSSAKLSFQAITVINGDEVTEYTPSSSTTQEPPNSILYTKISASESTTGEDTCIYVTNYESQQYMDAVNEERASWGLPLVGYSQDLEEGAMLRAGEQVESHYRGAPLGPHETYKFPAPTYENTAGSTMFFNYEPLYSFTEWMSEKSNLPNGYTPQANGYIAEYNGLKTGHYTAMVEPSVNYVGQGGAYADVGCDGGAYMASFTYYQEHYSGSTDLYPDLNSIVTGSYTPTPTYSSNNSLSTDTNVSSNTNVVSDNVNTTSRVGESIEEENLAQEKAEEEKKLAQQQNKENEAKQKENDTRREKEALLNDKTHKHRDDESLTTAGKSHFMTMMIWVLVISVVYFVGSKLLYLRNN